MKRVKAFCSETASLIVPGVCIWFVLRANQLCPCVSETFFQHHVGIGRVIAVFVMMLVGA